MAQILRIHKLYTQLQAHYSLQGSREIVQLGKQMHFEVYRDLGSRRTRLLDRNVASEPELPGIESLRKKNKQ